MCAYLSLFLSLPPPHYVYLSLPPFLTVSVTLSAFLRARTRSLSCLSEQAYGGMRSVKSMVYETSLLDPVEVRFDAFISDMTSSYVTRLCKCDMTHAYVQ